MKYLVYKIYNKSNPQMIYIGSTCDSLANRLKEAKNNYKRWKDGKRKYCCRYRYIFNLAKNDGDTTIDIINEFSADHKNVALFVEDHFIKVFRPHLDVVNRNKAFRRYKNETTTQRKTRLFKLKQKNTHYRYGKMINEIFFGDDLNDANDTF
jgi:hypothetical protein